MLLAGVLFDEGGPVASILFLELDKGKAAGYYDEEPITAALRALGELMSLGLLDLQLALRILDQIRDKQFTATKPHCCSAYIGTLGIFAKAAIDKDPSSAEALVSELEDIVRYWLPKWNNQGIIYEALWALNIVCRVGGAGLVIRWSTALQALVDDVEKDPNLVAEKDEGFASSEVLLIFKEADKLRRQISINDSSRSQSSFMMFRAS